MSMICINGCRECDGCMRCQKEDRVEFIGTCAYCDEPIRSNEDRYIFPDDDMTHDVCASDYIREHYYKPGEQSW